MFDLVMDYERASLFLKRYLRKKPQTVANDSLQGQIEGRYAVKNEGVEVCPNEPREGLKNAYLMPEGYNRRQN